jgi:hypothetical protein
MAGYGKARAEEVAAAALLEAAVGVVAGNCE